MHIYWLVNNVWPEIIGGVEKQIYTLAKGMKARGYDVTIIAFNKDKGTFDYSNGVIVKGLGKYKPNHRFWFLKPSTKYARASFKMPNMHDAVIFTADPILLVACKCRYPNVLVVYCPGGVINSSHTWEFGFDLSKWKNRLLLKQYLFFERVALKKADGVIAVSSLVQKQMNEVHVNKLNRVVITCPDAEFFHRPLPVRDYSVLRAITVGRLHRIKNMEYLLKAWQLCDIPQKNLTVVGSGPEEEYLRNMAVSLGIQDSVNFVGAKEHIIDYLDQSDIFILPSIYEALGIVVCEAFCRGLPCICLENVPGVSHVGACDDLVRPGETGYCSDPRDPASLARIIKDLSNNSRHIQDMSMNARRFAEKFLTVEYVTDEYIKVLQEVQPKIRG